MPLEPDLWWLQHEGQKEVTVMSRVLGPGGVGLGAVVIAVGAILQASGAEAAVFCSVIGAGIVLAVLGAVAWIVHFVRERKAPRSPLAA